MTRENQIFALDSVQFTRVLGKLLDASGDSVAYQDNNFVAWLEREVRGRSGESDDKQSDVAALEIARRAQTRIRAMRVGESIPLRSYRPRTASVVGNAKQVGQAAAEAGCAPWVESLAVAAGTGREIWDEPCEQWVELDRRVADGLVGGVAAHLALTVAGDSMTPCLHGGDLILVNTRKSVTRDCVVVARRADDGYVVKHVSRCGRKTLELSSFNSEYAPFTIDRLPGAIIGVVVARLVRDGGEP